MGYREEFPDFELDVAVPEDFEDTSWHNDACPSFSNARLGLHIFVDWKDRSRSDFPENTERFIVSEIDAEGQFPANERGPILTTNDWSQVLRLIGLRRRQRGFRANPDSEPHFASLKDKIRWEKQRRETEHRTWKALLEEAHRLAMVAGEITTPDPMAVTTPGGRLIEVVDDGVCGFAWVNFFPAKGGPSRRFANWVTGKTDSMSPPPIRAEFSSYGGGVRIWVSAFNQSMQRKENYARHLADTLQRMFPDAKAYMNSRMD